MGDFFYAKIYCVDRWDFFIACLQSVAEVFMNMNEKSYQAKILNVACFCGSLYLLLKYVFDNIIKDLISYINFWFRN